MVRDEVLFGIQAMHSGGHRWSLSDIRAVLDQIREQRVSRLVDLQFDGDHNSEVRRFVAGVRDAITVTLGDREAEVTKDVWDLRLWKLQGFLRFDGSGQMRDSRKEPVHAISQPWLRETAKWLAAQHLARDLSAAGAHKLVAVCGLWSRWLERREDHGLLPSSLRKSDVTNFVVHLSIRERNGEISNRYLADLARTLRRFLQDVHEQHLAERSGPCAGLSSEVALTRHDIPKETSSEQDDEVGEALPTAVIRQLLGPDSLALLSPAGQRRVRIALEVGRRPSELLKLPYECLAYDESVDALTGAVTLLPVLVHDMPKVRRTGYRLPISQATADLIIEQQRAVSERFPHVPTTKLALWPAFQRNAHGTQPKAAHRWAEELRTWVRQLQLVDGEVAPDGTVVPRLDHDGKPVGFPRQRVHPYAFRHTFAQRHIDAGTPVQTLQDLLGHSNINTTMGYYRIKMDKRRAAMEKLGALQLTAFGSRVSARGSTSSMAVRYEVGQVAVPFGVCVEPSNVRAHGQACQFRHRCFGCAHFRTDPSYLPELRAYLGEMLLAKERLTTALPELADWARAEALPHEEEIATVRGLITSCEQALEQLSHEEQHATEAAIAVLREARTHLDATFPVQFRALVMQPNPSVFPVLLRSPGAEAQAQTGVA